MNDRDHIRKAVELADGFDFDQFEDGKQEWLIEHNYSFEDGHMTVLCELDKVPQFMLDAIAAQLVRQVDALDDFSFSSDINRNAIVQKLDLHVPWLEGGPHRTMNTIKVVVDSKALE